MQGPSQREGGGHSERVAARVRLGGMGALAKETSYHDTLEGSAGGLSGPEEKSV